MYYLYLDESGDLGHYVDSPGSPRYFVITVLEVSSDKDRKAFEKAVERTIKNKLHTKHSRLAGRIKELKGASTELAIKKYFYRHVREIPFCVYAIILDKTRFGNHLQFSQHRLYRFITHLVLKELSLEWVSTRVNFVLDGRTRGASVQEFNKSLRLQLEERIPPQIPLFIDHRDSSATRLLQAVDLFAWGIFRKNEVGDTSWYDLFREKLKLERTYPDK
ncbi:MAG: DUF3800 domain-containing protein [candidate division KSB1 bacterium]|nr:DUF3800 domain-containing protein [candidate division KSB1 bacterium]MDZ7364790.1 DUF3800 domain-containing protein [candidate division KSB1 bacterium]MDZ7402893.1 DUF3800 domain-containing protein [candidate division KSB1 bacterium]